MHYSGTSFLGGTRQPDSEASVSERLGEERLQRGRRVFQDGDS